MRRGFLLILTLLSVPGWSQSAQQPAQPAIPPTPAFCPRPVSGIVFVFQRVPTQRELPIILYPLQSPAIRIIISDSGSLVV